MSFRFLAYRVAALSAAGAAAILCICNGAAADAQQPQDDAFEAALRTMPARAPSARAAQPVAATASEISGTSTKMAPPGLMPARFQKRLTGLDGMQTADQAVYDGELDALAFIEHQVGPIPLLPGTRQLRCRPDGTRVTFTLGIEASPEYRKAIDAYLAEQVQRRASAPPRVPGARRTSNREPRSLAWERMSELDIGAKNPVVRARMIEMATLLRSKGFVLWTGGALPMWRLGTTAPGMPTIDIHIIASPLTALIDCGPVGVQVPSGPIFTVRLTVPDPYWRNDVANPVLR